MRVTISYRDQTVFVADTSFLPSEDVWESIRTVLSTLLVRGNGRLQFTASEEIRFYMEEIDA